MSEELTVAALLPAGPAEIRFGETGNNAIMRATKQLIPVRFLADLYDL